MTVPTRSLGLDDWVTPPCVFGPVDAAFRFDLDACATNKTVAQVSSFIGPEENSLKVEWSDRGKRIWCNPPYGRGIDKWFRKSAEACENGCEAVVLLVYANTGTLYWRQWVADHPLVQRVILLAPRVRFLRPEETRLGVRWTQRKGAPKGSALVFYGPEERQGPLPHIYWNWKTERIPLSQ